VIGYAFCGSFCTHAASLEQLRRLLAAGYEVQPIFSQTVYETDTRFGRAQALREQVEALCGRAVLHTVTDTEPLGPRQPLQALVICPCTGNTLAKMAAGITDSAVTMAAKAHLRSNRPLVIALASNDALSANLKNIGAMLTRKNVYFVPMRQDDPEKKPHSLVADFGKLPATLEAALAGVQYQRLFQV
jgi:dipicolinate synthase subunit B